MSSADPKPVRTAWALTSGEAGLRVQARGLAKAVARDVVEKVVTFKPAWKRAPARVPFLLRGLDPASDPLKPPWPDLIVSCGRKAAAVALALRKRAGRSIALVHVQDPLTTPRGFDLVVAMRHDRVAGPNVIKLSSALHDVTPERLAQAGGLWTDRLARLPRPLVGVSLGGPTARSPFEVEQARELLEGLNRLRAATGAGVVVAPSRRTPEPLIQVLAQAWAGDPGAWVWDRSGDNPYLGMLALADRLVATADSVSMVSEALATGHPVEVFRLDLGRRHTRFIDDLETAGLVRAFRGDPDPPPAQPPIDATTQAAQAVRQMLARRASRPASARSSVPGS